MDGSPPAASPDQEAWHQALVEDLCPWLRGLTVTRVIRSGIAMTIVLDDLRDEGIWTYALVPLGKYALEDAAGTAVPFEASRVVQAIVEDVRVGPGLSTDLVLDRAGTLRFGLEHTGYEQGTVEGRSTFGDKRMRVIW